MNKKTTPKINKKSSTKNYSEAEKVSEEYLIPLAHRGDEESLLKIRQYIESEKDKDKQMYAELALQECELMYYSPRSEIEDKEFMLCFLIMKQEKYVFDLEMEIESIKSGLDKSVLDKEVHENILAKHKDKIKDWQYNWSPDFVANEENRLKEVSDSLAYYQAWIETAREMITVERYKTMPNSYLEHYSFSFED